MSTINRNYQLLSWMILIFCLIGHSLSKLSTPQNIATVKDASVRLNCSHSLYRDAQLVWSLFNFSASNQNEPSQISLGVTLMTPYVGQFLLDNSTRGNVDLLFKASEDASGLFVCQIDSRGGSLYSAQIIVLDPDPNCSKEKADDGSAKVDCSIGFSGFWTPRLEWLKADVKLESYHTTTTNKVTSSHLVKFKSPAPYDLTCTPKFPRENRPPAKIELRHIAARNIPEFPNSCTITIEPSEGGNEPPPRDESKEKATITFVSYPSATVSIHDWHDLHLSISLATLVFVGMLHI